MSRWSPQVKLVYRKRDEEKELLHLQHNNLLEELAKIFYDYFCQAQKARSKSILVEFPTSELENELKGVAIYG